MRIDKFLLKEKKIRLTAASGLDSNITEEIMILIFNEWEFRKN